MLSARVLLSILCAVWLGGMGFAAAQKPADVTGSYGMLGSCSDKEMDNSLDEISVRHCFLGKKYAAYAEMSLIQNGHSVCGSYSECGGINCSRVYTGQLVGKIAGDKLTLFMETGHREDGPAEERIYRIVPSGLADGDQHQTDKPVHVRRAKVLENPSLRNACNPVIPKEVLLKNFTLDVPGILTTADIRFLDAKNDVTKKAPPAKQFNLSKLSSNYQWTDQRSTGNYVPRLITIHNDSKKEWTVVAGYSETCRDFLSRDPETGRLVYDAQFEGLGILPDKTLTLPSCKDTIFTLEDKAACPRFTCSENCRC
ncbi:hypothetical protein [Polaromonas sp.]|uniref:hypothetical protein n=1 Tax=Polaromonas sp. TaxID=1869339 RepID=UPI003266CE37